MDETLEQIYILTDSDNNIAYLSDMEIAVDGFIPYIVPIGNIDVDSLEEIFSGDFAFTFDGTNMVKDASLRLEYDKINAKAFLYSQLLENIENNFILVDNEISYKIKYNEFNKNYLQSIFNLFEKGLTTSSFINASVNGNDTTLQITTDNIDSILTQTVSFIEGQMNLFNNILIPYMENLTTSTEVKAVSWNTLSSLI